MMARALLAFLAVAMAPALVTGQDLARRVTAVDEGTVRLLYPTRPGVEICDQGIRMGDHQMMWWSRHGEEVARNCRPGPAEIELRVRDGRVRGIDLIRRERDRTEGAVDLGTVAAQEAVDYLMELARSGASGRGEEEAVFPAVLADVEGLWRDLLALGRDANVDEDVRTSAIFWVGQEAADAVTEGLAGVAMDRDEEQEVRDAAVFALSQRPNDEAVPILMEVARTAPGAETRKSAMFWLAQSEDERALTFFEEILLGRRGGG
jgi:hypothetical protein